MLFQQVTSPLTTMQLSRSMKPIMKASVARLSLLSASPLSPSLSVAELLMRLENGCDGMW